MSSAPTKAQNKPKDPAETNLAPLLRHFVGIDLLVETKQGRTLRGKLREADAYMNLVLSRPIPTTKGSQPSQSTRPGQPTPSSEGSVGPEVIGEQFDWLHIRGPSIRYIVFGAGVDIPGVIKAGRDRERAAGDKYRRGVRKAPRR